MEIKRLHCKPTSLAMGSALFFFPFVSRQIPAQHREDGPVKGNVSQGGGESGGPREDSITLAVKRLIRIECSIDVKPPSAPAAGILITGFPLWGIIWCNEIKFMLPGGYS